MRYRICSDWHDIIRRHNLREHIVFNTNFIGSVWDDVRQKHTITLQRSATGETYEQEVDVLISAAGPLSTPSFPKVEGLEQFKGTKLHSSEWDTRLPLEGKRVAVIGNGSTGIQIVPGIATLPNIQVKHFIRSSGCRNRPFDSLESFQANSTLPRFRAESPSPVDARIWFRSRTEKDVFLTGKHPLFPSSAFLVCLRAWCTAHSPTSDLPRCTCLLYLLCF
jgi:cation diffusion facilitator CzcD-associated flavoprotein CzcO